MTICLILFVINCSFSFLLQSNCTRDGCKITPPTLWQNWLLYYTTYSTRSVLEVVDDLVSSGAGGGWGGGLTLVSPPPPPPPPVTGGIPYLFWQYMGHIAINTLLSRRQKNIRGCHFAKKYFSLCQWTYRQKIGGCHITLHGKLT